MQTRKNAQKTERKYGITVTQTLAKNTHDTITSNSAAGDDLFDLVFVYVNNVVYDNGIFYSDNVMLYGIYNKTIPAANSNILLTTLTSLKKSAQSAIDKINNAFEG